MVADFIDSVEGCQHFKFGYCRYLNTCKKKHDMEICNEKDCSVVLCRKRHPKVCRYFAKYERCKFGTYCKYLHKPSTDTILELFESKMKDLESMVDHRNRHRYAILYIRIQKAQVQVHTCMSQEQEQVQKQNL